MQQLMRFVPRLGNRATDQLKRNFATHRAAKGLRFGSHPTITRRQPGTPLAVGRDHILTTFLFQLL